MPDAERPKEEPSIEPPYSIFTEFEKKAYAWVASIAAFASPVSSTIYYPALNVLAADLHTTATKINLTITTYLIFQGLSPTIIGGISDRYGRRPAYLICFTLFIAANIGLALQTNYAALLVLRCLQSCGSSGTVALSNGTVSDLATRAERGRYIGLAALGSSLGPALGPVIGGLLTHFLGWRSIFWFLAIYGWIMLTVFLTLIPETCRNIVGNGSIPPQKWNVSLITYLKHRKQSVPIMNETIQKKKRPGLLSSIPIILEKEAFLLLIFGAVFYAGFYTILAGLPFQLETTYRFNSIQIGLCYIPIGMGSIVSKTIVGRSVDWNFRRHAKNHGLEVVKGRQQDITDFPVERARLEISMSCIYLACATMIPYGWVMHLNHPPLAAVIVLLFLLAIVASGAMQAMSVLVVDIHPRSPAAASAANNLVRCLLGAGGVALAVPLVDQIGRGWTCTLIALIWVLMSSCWWAVIIRGPRWRKARKSKEDLIKRHEMLATV